MKGLLMHPPGSSHATSNAAGVRGLSHPAAFTLIEILIVVVILGILAAIVLPQITSAADQSRRESLRMNLHRIRQQLEIYAQQHNSTYPDSLDKLTEVTNAQGQTTEDGASSVRFGPYLTQIPTNPFTGGRTIGTGAVGESDWYYNSATGTLCANDTAEHRAY